MAMQSRKASRQKAKIRLGFSSVSGGGKTISALLVAFGLVESWDLVGVVDTENNSSEVYVGKRMPDGTVIGEFNVIPLEYPYTPERYIEAINALIMEGNEVIIVDSITHEWDGKGGILETLDQLGGKYQAWATLTPRHQAFIQAILLAPVHMITTVRRKQDYEMSKDGDGKMTVTKLGLKEITREGFEYEVTTNLELDIKHNATASKDRTGLFMDKPSFVPSIETGRAIRKWCESGVDAIPLPTEKPKDKITDAALDKAIERMKNGEDIYDKIVSTLDLTPEQKQTVDGIKQLVEDEAEAKIQAQMEKENQEDLEKQKLSNAPIETKTAVDAIINPDPEPPAKKPKPSVEDLFAIEARIKTGNTETLEKAKAFYTLTKKQIADLDKLQADVIAGSSPNQDKPEKPF